MKKVIYTILVLLWMTVIFLFSANPADESTQISHSAGKMIGEIFVREFHEWPEQKQEEFAERIDYPVRKCAHASEYAVLGILLWLFISAYRDKGINILTFFAGAAYAASDEFHQLYVPGRSGQLSDVILDTSGVLLGLLLIYIARTVKKTEESKKKSSKIP